MSVIAFITAVLAEEPPLSLSISIPSSPSGEHELDDGRIPHFHIILLNSSDRPQRVWAPWSEASDSVLTFEFTNEEGKKWTVRRKFLERVSHQLPEVSVLQPHESLVFNIYYANTNVWENFPKAMPGYPAVAMRAIFEIRSNPGTELNKVWAGKIVSEPLKVTIYPWEPRKDK